MSEKLITAEEHFRIEFYDVDSMEVAWHGNYIKYLELGRCALLDKIGYGYKQMKETGYVFPVTNLSVKYVRSLRFGEKAVIKSTLLEYENRIKIKYEIFNEETGELATKAESTQMAVKVPEMSTQFVCPDVFLERVKEILNNEK